MKWKKKTIGIIVTAAILCTAIAVGIIYREPIKDSFFKQSTEDTENSESDKKVVDEEQRGEDPEQPKKEGYFKQFVDNMDRQELDKGIVEAELKRYEEEGITVKDIRTTYDGSYVKNALWIADNNGKVAEEVSSPDRRLVEIDESMPMEYMHKVDDTMFYSVYRLEEKGIEYYMYMFFEDGNRDDPEKDKEYWWITKWVLFAAKKLSSEDFKDIGPGSTLEEVNAIDPMTSIYRPMDMEGPLAERSEVDWIDTDWYTEHSDDYRSYAYVPEYQAYHLLTDGILYITYHRDNVEEEYVVKSVELKEDFELPLPYKKTTHQKVDPEDLPPASESGKKPVEEEQSKEEPEQPKKEGYFKQFTEDMGRPGLAKGIVEQELDRYERENITVGGIQTTYDGIKVRNNLSVTRDDGKVNTWDIGVPRSLVRIDNYMPIEYMHKADDNVFYSVYQLEENGIAYYMYLFFWDRNTDEVSNFRNRDLDPEEDKKYWWITDRVLYAAKRLSSEDFKDIGPGSTLEEVNAIDPMTNIYRPEDREVPLRERFDVDWINTDWVKNHNYDDGDDYGAYTYVPEYRAYHLLTDGILCITYHRDSAEEEFVVKGVEFKEDFEFPVGPYGKTIHQKVAPEDYPPADK